MLFQPMVLTPGIRADATLLCIRFSVHATHAKDQIGSSSIFIHIFLNLVYVSATSWTLYSINCTQTLPPSTSDSCLGNLYLVI